MRNCRVLASAVTAVALAVGSSISVANPYASGITESGGTVSFYLNESATDVTIFRDGVPTPLGALGAGQHNFSRDGASLYYIQVSKVAAPGWTQISTDAPSNAFFIPRGVAINNNPSDGGAPNPLFGRTYVSEARGGTTTVGAGNTRTTTDGIYLYNADLSPADGQGDTARTAGIPFLVSGDTGGVSPFRVFVGPDNSLYITDWSDSHSSLWQTNPNVTSAVEVLDSTGRNAAGLNATHGSISDVFVVGTGANRTIYTTDEDFDDGLAARRGSVLRYDIGNTATFTGPPSAIAYDDSVHGNIMINFTQSLVVHPDGTIWVSQNRANGTDQASLIQYDPATDQVLFNSLTNMGSPDPLRGAQGIAYDPVNDVFAIATDGNQTGRIIIFDGNTKTIIDSFLFGANTNRDVAFDAAGNLYVVNSSAERLRVWSPGGSSVFSTGSDGSFFAGLVPEPSALALLGLGSLGLLARRRRIV